MALPAGRYGVTKNQLLKIKKLPMNTIKLIEEIQEELDTFGTAVTHDSISVVTDSSDLVESGAVYDAIKGSVGFVTTGKNLFDGKATSKTDQYGVTWAVDPSDNNVVTVSGTPTDVEAFRQFSDKVLPTGIYKFYGLSNTTNIAFNALVLYQDSTVVRVITSLTDGGEFEVLSSDVYNRIGIEYKRGVNGTPCSGTIRTMITKATITNSAYEPYHESVEETLRDAEVIEGKNLLSIPNSITTQTINGITFTVNRNNNGEVTSIIANGTAVEDATLLLVNSRTDYNPKILGHKIMLSGCPQNGSFFTYHISLSTWGTLPNVYDAGSGVEVDIPLSITGFRVDIVIKANQTVSNLKFEPMIRFVTEEDASFEPYYIPLKDVVPNKADNSVIGTVEGSTASKAWSVGEHFIKDGAFCTVTQAIAQGGSFILGTNYTAGDVAKLLTYDGEIEVFLNQLTWIKSASDSYYAECISLDNDKKLLSVTLGTWESITPDEIQFIPFISSTRRGVYILSKTNTFSIYAATKLIYTYRYI